MSSVSFRLPDGANDHSMGSDTISGGRAYVKNGQKTYSKNRFKVIAGFASDKLGKQNADRSSYASLKRIKRTVNASTFAVMLSATAQTAVEMVKAPVGTFVKYAYQQKEKLDKGAVEYFKLKPKEMEEFADIVNSDKKVVENILIEKREKLDEKAAPRTEHSTTSNRYPTLRSLLLNTSFDLVPMKPQDPSTSRE